MTNAEQAHELLHRISEPIEEVSDDRIVDCPTCDGATRTFDDPADCPECAGTRYVVL
jgi:DnaJ-class molecular chaperone